MLDAYWNQYKAEVDKLSISQLKENIAKGVYAGEKLGLAHFVLENKEREENNIKWKQNLDLTEKNVKSTRRLVWATWGLVIVTVILAIVTFFKR